MGEQLCPLSYQAAYFPDHIALITPDQKYSYRLCDQIVNNLCQQLQAQGVGPHCRVAFIAHTDVACIFFFFALFRLRAIACPLSFRQPVEQLPFLLQELRASHYLQPKELSLLPSSLKGPCTLFEEDLATFFFTSGSSGNPKIACHSLANHLYSALGAIDFFGLNPTSRWQLSLPLFHVGGLAILFRMFLSGATVLLCSLDRLQEYLPTHLSLVPTQLIRLLRTKAVEHYSAFLKCLLLGGAPLSAALCQKALQYGLPLVCSYGMTEMSSLITAGTTHAGKPLPFRECTLSANKEVLVKGQTLFKGYWNGKTEQILSPSTEGWFATQDIAEFTESKDLRIIGRTDRLFISGGENIYPEEIENALCRIPGILNATVVACDDPEFGKRPVAFIDDETSSHCLASIRQALCTQLPSFKHPIHLLPYPKDVSDSLKISPIFLADYLNNNFSLT